MTKNHPALKSAAPISKRKLAWLCKREGSGLKVQYLCSLVPISSAESSPGLRGFSWQALDCTRRDLLAQNEAIPGYQSLHSVSSPGCKQGFDCPCLSGMI